MTLFDPGWRGEQTKGPEDWGVADLGNDPMGIIDRYGRFSKLARDICARVLRPIKQLSRNAVYTCCHAHVVTIYSQQHLKTLHVNCQSYRAAC